MCLLLADAGPCRLSSTVITARVRASPNALNTERFDRQGLDLWMTSEQNNESIPHPQLCDPCQSQPPVGESLDSHHLHYSRIAKIRPRPDASPRQSSTVRRDERTTQPPQPTKVEAILADLSKWSALEVAAEIESWLVPALYGKQGKAIKKLSQSMGGVVLRVTDGVCRGRATSLELAREATQKLQERVRETTGQNWKKSQDCWLPPHRESPLRTYTTSEMILNHMWKG